MPDKKEAHLAELLFEAIYERKPTDQERATGS
jgi:hypothetical protein